MTNPNRPADPPVTPFHAPPLELDEAYAVITRLARSLFPDGPPDRAQVTWPDPPDGGAKATTGPADTAADTEARLREAEARFRTLVEQIPAVTFMAVLGEGKNEIYVSPHIESMLGFTQREWLENPFLWYSQLHPDDRALWNEEFARGCQTGGPFRAECRFIARDGRVVWVHGEARLARDDRGRPMFLQGVAFDITETKRAQEILLTEAVRSARSEEELAIARRVQTSILPQATDVEGLEVAAVMVPASEVGGDYYDVLPTRDGAWLAIGDVSGHGLNSGLVMLMAQSAMSATTRANPAATPREVLAVVNDVLYENIRTRIRGDDHVTMTLLRYTRDGRVTFAGAHEDMLLCRKSTGRVKTVPTPGPWVGAARDIRAAAIDTTFQLQDGDLVVLYTDGVTEAMNAEGEMFDIDRLCATVEEVRAESPARIRDHVMGKVRAWMVEQADDISLVVLRYRAPRRA